MIRFLRNCDKDFIDTVARSITLRAIVYVSLAINALIMINAAVSIATKGI